MVLTQSITKPATVAQFKTISSRPYSNDVQGCIDAAAKAAWKYGIPYYVVRIYGGCKILNKLPKLVHGQIMYQLTCDKDLNITCAFYQG